MVENWRVLEDPSFSDHKYISFRMDCDRNRVSGRSRNPRNTDWDRYTTVLSEILGKPGRIISYHDLESKVDTLSKSIEQGILLILSHSPPETKIKASLVEREMVSARNLQTS